MYYRKQNVIKRVIELIISLLYFLLVKPILFTIRHGKEDCSRFCVILFYHTVYDSERHRFIAQMKLLSLLTSPIAIDIPDSFPAGKRFSIITFDDAFQNVVRNAVPELLKRNIPFTIFVPSGQLGKEPEWVAGTGLIHEHEKLASTEELLRLPERLASIGSHTINHPRLSQLGEEQAYYEIKQSKMDLESLLRRPVKYISTPYGENQEQILALCKKAGYEQAFTIEIPSPFSLFYKYGQGRMEADPSDWYLEFILTILGAYDWMRVYRMLRVRLKALMPNSMVS